MRPCLPCSVEHCLTDLLGYTSRERKWTPSFKMYTVEHKVMFYRTHGFRKRSLQGDGVLQFRDLRNESNVGIEGAAVSWYHKHKV